MGKVIQKHTHMDWNFNIIKNDNYFQIHTKIILSNSFFFLFGKNKLKQVSKILNQLNNIIYSYIL